MYIFISYSDDKINNKHGEDYYLVSAVRDRFEQMTAKGEGDFEVFLDDRIELGEDWENAIEEALLKSDYMLLFISEHSRRPDSFCRNENIYVREINAIRKKKKQKEIVVIPVRLDESLPPISLIKAQAVIWMEKDKLSVFDEKFNKILHRLGAAPKGEPEPVESVRDKIWFYITKGDLALLDRDMEVAFENYEKAYKLAKEEADKNETEDTLHDLGAVLQKLGTTYEIKDNLTQAKKYYVEYFDISKEKAKKYPSYYSLRSVSISLNKMGDIALKEDDVKKAKEHYEKSLEIRRENAEKHPSYLSNRDLSISIFNMGDIALREDDINKAKDYFTEYLKMTKENAQKHPSYESNRDLSVSLNNMGDIALKEDDVTGAKEYYLQDLEIARENAQKHPSYESNRDLSASLQRMGEVAYKENNIEKAKEWYLKCLDIDKDNADKFPSYETFFDTSEIYAEVAKTEKALSNTEEAKKLLNNALRYATKALRIRACDESIENFTEIQKELASL